jgi:hypothetical protein
MAYLPVARAIAVALFALAVGLFCGYLNLRLLTAAGERLAESGRSKGFVISSLTRVALFAIVAVAFAAAGPWWSSLLFIAGLLMPVASYAIRVARER